MKILKLLAYSRYLRHSYLDTLSKLPWEEVVKYRGASFNSLRDIFLHCVSIIDSWINRRIQGDNTRSSINYEDFNSIEQIRAYLERVESVANEYLNRVTPEELTRKIDRVFKDGSSTQVTVEDILIDFFQEETHHRGEFIAILWQIGVEPPHVGWCKYLKQTKADR